MQVKKKTSKCNYNEMAVDWKQGFSASVGLVIQWLQLMHFGNNSGHFASLSYKANAKEQREAFVVTD